MKMLWKLTDNIKYEDCEVSAARAQSLPRLQARSSASLLSSPPAARGGWDKLCPALRPPLRFALRAQGRSQRGRLGTFPSFTLLLRSPLSHSPRPAPIFSGPVLSVAKDGRAWVFEVVTGNRAGVCELRLSLQRASEGPGHQSEKGKTPFPL